MKKILLSIILLIIATLGFSQETQIFHVKKYCNADIFANTTGVFIKQEYKDIIEIRKCKISVVDFTNLSDNKSISALRFEFLLCNAYRNIDEDEVDALLKSLKNIQSNIITTKPNNYTEIIFKSRSGFEFGCYFEDGKWLYYMRVDYIEKINIISDIKLDKSDIMMLISALDQAKAKM